MRLKCVAYKSPDILGEGDEGSPLEVSVLLLGDPAPKMAPYLYEGRRVVVDGSLASAEWETSGTKPMETVCVLGQRVEFLGNGPQRAVIWPREDWRDEASDTGPMLGFSEDVWE